MFLTKFKAKVNAQQDTRTLLANTNKAVFANTTQNIIKQTSPNHLTHLPNTIAKFNKFGKSIGKTNFYENHEKDVELKLLDKDKSIVNEKSQSK